MNPHLRDRILRKLESLSDERAYQVLDYVEFMESKYAERQNPPPNVLQRFAETVEDRLRAGRVSAATISEAMGLMNRAVAVLNGVAAAGKSVASDIVGAAGARPAGAPAVPPAPAAPPAPPPPPGAPSAAQPTGAQSGGAQPAAPAPPPGAPPAPPAPPAPLAPQAPPAPAQARPPQSSGEQPT